MSSYFFEYLSNMNCQRHFSETYNIRIFQPKAFGIITGSKERKVVYPAEVCTVEAGQFYRKKAPAELTKSVVDFATKSPQERLRIINSGIGVGERGGLAAPVSNWMLPVTAPQCLLYLPRLLSMRRPHLSKPRGWQYLPPL
jgi:hypothetical protein